jgi:proline dehydrogenase
MLAQQVRRLAARRYLAGAHLADALEREEALRGGDRTTAIGYWNAAGENPDAVEDVYNRSLDALAARPGVQLSCKPTALNCEPRRIEALAQRARQAGVPLHFDSLSPEVATEALAATLAAGAGVTLPGRWRRSCEDAERLASTGLPVRVIKGQWPDRETPDRDLRDGFLAVVERLAGRSAQVAVATHDGPLAAEALGFLSAAGTPSELQLLLGLPSGPSLQSARDIGVGVRVYVPFGVPHLPYSLRELPRHPARTLRLGADLLRGSSRAAL